MNLIFSHLFREGNERTGFTGLTVTGQEKMLANMQEVTGLLSHLHCREHPYVLVPVTTAHAGEQMHNTFFVCCSACKEMLARALPYGRAHFEVVCLRQEDASALTHP